MIYRLFLIGFLLVGCSKPSETLPYPLTISEEGIGAIHPNTPIDQLNTTLSGFEFQKLNPVSPDQQAVIFQIKRGDTLIAQIFSDGSGKKISSIHILSPLIKNKSHVGLGDRLPSDKKLVCDHDLCHTLDEPSLHYRLDPLTRIVREITFSRL